MFVVKKNNQFEIAEESAINLIKSKHPYSISRLESGDLDSFIEPDVGTEIRYVSGWSDYLSLRTRTARENEAAGIPEPAPAQPKPTPKPKTRKPKPAPG